MKVTNWYKWTRFKKRVVLACLLMGFILVFAMENGGDAYGYWGVAFSLFGAYVISTIDRNDW
jgi:hypothetical protein